MMYLQYKIKKQISGNYIQRILAMIIMTLVFSTFMFKPIWLMMRHDDEHRKLKAYKEVFKYQWGKRGLWRGLLKPYFFYYHPRFHPKKIKNDQLIKKWTSALSKEEDNQSRLALLQTNGRLF